MLIASWEACWSGNVRPVKTRPGHVAPPGGLYRPEAGQGPGQGAHSPLGEGEDKLRLCDVCVTLPAQVERQMYRQCPQPHSDTGAREGIYVLTTGAAHFTLGQLY